MQVELKGKIDLLSEKIFELTDETFNLNSPKQLGKVLFEKMEIRPAKKTATGYSTSADVLESLREDNPIIDKVL